MKLADILTERKHLRGQSARPGEQKTKVYGRGAKKEALKRKAKHNRWKRGLTASINNRPGKVEASREHETLTAVEQQ